MQNTTLVLSISLAVSLIVIAVLFYKRSSDRSACEEQLYHQHQACMQALDPKNGEDVAPQAQGGAPSGDKPAFVFFFAEWCPNSTGMFGAWEEAAKTLSQEGVNVILLDDKKHHDEMQKMDIKGFPTLRLYPSGFPSEQFVEYQGDRSAASLIKFVQSGGQAI